MVFREALLADIQQIQLLRHAVKENVLSDPALVSDKDCEEYLSVHGKGRVCEAEKEIVGSAIADLKITTSGPCLCCRILQEKAW